MRTADVPDVAAEVQRRSPAVDGLEVLAVGREPPAHTGLQRGQPHVLDLVERAQSGAVAGRSVGAML